MLGWTAMPVVGVSRHRSLAVRSYGRVASLLAAWTGLAPQWVRDTARQASTCPDDRSEHDSCDVSDGQCAAPVAQQRRKDILLQEEALLRDFARQSAESSVNIALGCFTEGRGYREYERDWERARLAHAPLDPRHGSRRFARAAPLPARA